MANAIPAVEAQLSSTARKSMGTAAKSRARADDVFFVTAALLILAAIFIGFARTYYLAGMLHAHLPTVLIHVHGALMSCWILLFIAQVALVSAKRIAWHMRLGILGMGLAGLIVPIGFATLIQTVRHRYVFFGKNMDTVFAGDVLQLSLFVALIIWGFCLRRDGAAHKRLMLLAMVTLLGPAIARWPFAFAHSFVGFFSLLDAIPLLLIAFDLLSPRKLHRATILGIALILVMQFSMVPLAHSAFWHHFTLWVQNA